MPTTKLIPLLAATAAVAVSALPSSAAVVLSEDFETDFGVFTNRTRSFLTTNGGTNANVSGAGAQYARINNNRPGPGFPNAESGLLSTNLDGTGFSEPIEGSVFSIDFLFYEESIAGQTDPMYVRTGSSNASGSSEVDVRLDDGTISAYLTSDSVTTSAVTYSLGAANNLRIVANDSTDAVVYDGVNSLLPNTYDVFLTNSLGVTALALDNVPYRSTQTTNLFAFQSFSNNRQTLIVDNVLIQTVVPEPSSVAALSLLSLVGLRRRR